MTAPSSALDFGIGRPLWTRRHALAGLGAWAALAGKAHAQDGDTIRLGQSVAVSGPLGELGQALVSGANACFAAVKAKGGVNGKTIELITRDDGYDVQRATDNTAVLLEDRSIFGLFNSFGTPMIEAVLPKVIAAGIPFFAPYSGAMSIRSRHARNVIHIRASYADEADQLVQHLATVGIRRIAIVHQGNSFGKEFLTAAQQALARHKLEAVVTVTVENSGADAAAAASKVAGADPEAALLGLAGKPTTEFVRSIRQERKGLQLYALSVMGTATTVKTLGENATGMTVAQVVPLPSNSSYAIVRECQQAWATAAPGKELSHTALEGYINAKAFVELLRKTGKNPTRSAFLDAVWSTKTLDLGGFVLHFNEDTPNASRFVELTMVSRQGRFIR